MQRLNESSRNYAQVQPSQTARTNLQSALDYTPPTQELRGIDRLKSSGLLRPNTAQEAANYDYKRNKWTSDDHYYRIDKA